MQVNGQDYAWQAGLTVAAIVTERGLRAENVVVEKNGEIVPKPDYGLVLKAEDTLEIVHFVGGG